VVTVNWQGDMVFEAQTPTGTGFVMDAYPEEGKQSMGPTPVQALLSSIAACSAMDVVMILQKKRQKVESYRVEVSGERVPPGEWPRPFLSITVKHVIKGVDIDPEAVKRAVELTDEKYCSVIATLRQAPTVESVWEIES
jgi:putative redox protein